MLVLLGLVSAVRPEAGDPSTPAAEIVRRSWTAQNGLPHNAVHALFQTRDGYLWLGTPSGLARFDGVRFETFNRVNTPGLAGDRVLSLAEDGRGVLWAGTDGGGLFAFRNGFPDAGRIPPSLLDPHVRALATDRNGSLWAGTEYGLVRIGEAASRRFTTGDGLLDNLVTCLEPGTDGSLWIGTMGGGLSHYRDGAFTNYGFEQGLTHPSVLSLCADEAGGVWIGTLEGLFTMRRGEARIRPIPGTSYTPVTSLSRDGRGSVWIGTMTDGLKRGSGQGPAPFSAEPASPADYIHALFRDASGGLWVGTETAGLVRLGPSRVESITKRQGLPEQGAVCVIEDRKGRLWVGTRHSGVCLFAGNRPARRITTDSGLSSNRIAALLEREDGIWVGTRDSGIDVVGDGGVRHIGRAQGLASDRITVLAGSAAGGVWIGTEQGLFEYFRGTVKAADGAVGLGRTPVRALADGREGLTVGTDSGVFRATRRGFVTLPEEHRNRPLDVRCLHEDAGGVLWIGTDGSGLLRLSGDSLASWTMDDGLPDNAVFGIAEDDSGALWMGTGKGLFRAHREDFRPAPGAGKPFLLPLVLDEEEGLPGRSCGAEGRPALTAGRSGRILAALGSGVAVVDPAVFSVPARTPKSVVESVTVDGRVHPAAGEGPRSFRGRRLEVAFTAPCLDAPEKVRFRYRLLGYDPDWRYPKPSVRRTAVYENLPPKKHRFLVQASGNGGPWESGGSVLEFDLSRPGIAGPAVLWGILPALAALFAIARAVRRFRAGRNPRPKYRTSALAPERTETVFPMLLELMEKEKPHLDPDLTLPVLAKTLRIHPNHLSQIIHEKLGLSFNDFVNRHRIGEAQRRMADPAFRDKTVLEILLETGFYSKSVFNSAFKKVTGMTPSQFKKTLS